MASTSTSKQPMLVDRPFHRFVRLGSVAALSTSTNYNTINSAGCELLLDCSSNDGGFVDAISIVANESGTTASVVLIFLSTATTLSTVNASNSACVASATIGSSSAGERTNISLPPLTVPVPNLGAVTSATELVKKNTGLYVPAGSLLYAGLTAVLTAPSSATVVSVFAQGGFY